MRLILLLFFVIGILDARVALNVCSFKIEDNIQKCRLKVENLLQASDFRSISVNIKKENDIFFVQLANFQNDKDVNNVTNILKDEFPDIYGLNIPEKTPENIETPINIEVKTSENNSTKKELKPKNKDDYDLAIKYFKEKNFQKSFEIFEKLFYDDLENADINFYLGRSAYEIKNYDEAVNAFDRILITYPDNKRAKLEKARTLFALKLYDEAKAEFEAILIDKTLPTVVKNNINKYLELISKNQKRHFFKGVFIGSFGYDGNTNSGVSEDIINQTVTFKSTNSNKPQSDSFHQELFVFNYIYDMGKKGGDLFKQDIIIMNKVMSEYYDKNVLYLSLIPKYTNKFGKYSYEIGLNYDFLWYGSNRLMDTVGATIKGERELSKISKVDLYLKLSKKMNKKISDKDKDSFTYEIGSSYKYNFSKTLTGGIKYQYIDENGKDTPVSQPLDVTKKTNALTVDIAKKVFNDINLKYILNYKQIDYKNVNTYGTKRDDNVYSHTFSISKPIDKTSLIDFKINYTKTDSDQDTYNTDKTVGTVNYIKSF